MADDSGLTDRQRARVGALRVAFELAGDDADLDRVKDIAEFIVADDDDFDDDEEPDDEEPEDEEPEEDEPPTPRKRAAKKQ